jgi:hypothetical protein
VLDESHAVTVESPKVLKAVIAMKVRMHTSTAFCRWWLHLHAEVL